MVYIYIYANIWGILMVNVTIDSIHGSYGLVFVSIEISRLYGIRHLLFSKPYKMVVSLHLGYHVPWFPEMTNDLWIQCQTFSGHGSGTHGYLVTSKNVPM